MLNINKMIYNLIERIFFACICMLCLIPNNVRLMDKSIATITIWPLCFCVVIRMAFATYKPLRLSFFPISIFLGITIPWIILLAFVGFSENSDTSIYEVWRSELAIPSCCFFIAIFCVGRDNFVNKLSMTIIFITIIVLGVEAAEVATGVNPLTRLPGFDVGALGVSDRDGMNRARSTFTHPLVLAQFFALATPFICYHYANAKRLGKAIAIFLLPLIILGGAYTVSRTSLLIIVLSMFLFYIIKHVSSAILRHDFAKVALLISTAFFTLILAIPAASSLSDMLLKGKSASEISSSAARVTMHENGIRYLLEQPEGYGYGQANLLVGQLTAGRNGTHDVTVDDYFLIIGLDFGMLTLLIMIINALALPCVALRRDFLNTTSPDVAALVGAVSVAWLITAFIQSIEDLHFIYYTCAGLAVGGLMMHRTSANFEPVNDGNSLEPAI